MRTYYQLDLVKPADQKEDMVPIFIMFDTPEQVKVTQQGGGSELQAAEYVHKKMAHAVHMQILNGSPPKVLSSYEFTGDMAQVSSDNPLLHDGAGNVIAL